MARALLAHVYSTILSTQHFWFETSWLSTLLPPPFKATIVAKILLTLALEQTTAPFLSLTVSHDPEHIVSNVKQVSLAAFPSWDEADLHLERCKNGITNKSMDVYLNDF